MELKFLIRGLVIFLTVVSCAPLPPPDKRLAEAEARIKALEAEISRTEAALHKAEQSLEEGKRNLEIQFAEVLRLRQDLQEREEATMAMRSDQNRAEELRKEAHEAQRKITFMGNEVARLRRQKKALTKVQSDHTKNVKELKKDIAEAKVADYRDGSKASNELRKNYKSAVAGYMPPTTMMVGDITKVSLKVSLEDSVKEIRAKLQKQAEDEKVQIRTKEIKVYDKLRATLTGSKGLTVISLDEQSDRLLEGGSQEWSWSVQAVEYGTQTLYLTLSALIRDEKGAVDVIDTWHDEVLVSVSPTRALYSFWENNWQWIWSALVVPIAIFLWEMRRRRKRRGLAAKETPTPRLDIESPTGYIQLRMRYPYTPTGADDTNGTIGDIVWDNNYMYVKTSSGWKKAPISNL